MPNQLISKTFLWMFLGLLTTFLTGYLVSQNQIMSANVFKGSTYIILCVIEVILVIVLSARIKKMEKTTARIMFILYSFITGLTFSSIFIFYELVSILYIFLLAAVLFLAFGLIGYYTKFDLTRLGTYLIMAILAVIVCFLINLFTQSSAFDLILSIISILIFIGFTAYDVQKIKRLGENGDIPEENLSIIGALNLYLDYINIFVDLLRIFGDLKD